MKKSKKLKSKTSGQMGGPSVDKTEAAPMHKGEALEGPTLQMHEDEEAPGEHELDTHMNDLLRAETVRGNEKLMGHLKNHMNKKVGQMQKITSIAELKRVAKRKAMED